MHGSTRAFVDKPLPAANPTDKAAPPQYKENYLEHLAALMQRNKQSLEDTSGSSNPAIRENLETTLARLNGTAGWNKSGYSKLCGETQGFFAACERLNAGQPPGNGEQEPNTPPNQLN